MEHQMELTNVQSMQGKRVFIPQQISVALV
jgi:hypothetical protein